MTGRSCFPDQILTAGNVLMQNPFPEERQIGAWRVAPAAGRILRAGEERALEPKVMDLLMLLAQRPGVVVTHEEIYSALWPGVVVGEDALARCVSKLRRALDDDAKTPAYVETISKRGYRLIAPVSAPAAARPSRRPWLMLGAGVGALLIAASALWAGQIAGGARESDLLIARAKDAYFQYTRADNETAIALYEQVLAAEPDNAPAQAGLATALVQRVIRWPNPPGAAEYSRTTLGEAFAAGRTDTPEARAHLARARDLADRAARRAPNDAFVQQSLGLTAAAQRDFSAAQGAYERAVAVDADAWGALINLGDMQDITGARANALPYFERAYAAMERAYASEPQRVRPWLAAVGVLAAGRHAEAGRPDAAEAWYRRVLAAAPLDAPAVAGLADILAARGQPREARDLCARLIERTGPNPACERFLVN